MHIEKRNLINFAAYLVYSGIFLSTASAAFSPSVQAGELKKLVMGAPDKIPPFYMENGQGIGPDTFRAALEPFGYTIVFKSMNNKRIADSIKNKKIDIAPFAVADTEGAYNSVEYIEFLNVAVTKKSRNLEIK